jgi:hypothetical protein
MRFHDWNGFIEEVFDVRVLGCGRFGFECPGIFLVGFDHAVDEFNAIKESLKLESPKNGLRALRPIRNGFQVKVDLFGGQGWHNIELFLVPAGAALFAAAGEFVDGGPSAGFGGFQAETFLFVAGFDMRRLTFLFVRVAGFITLGHDGFFWVEIIFAKAFRGAAR